MEHRRQQLGETLIPIHYKSPKTAAETHERVNILGVRASAINMSQALSIIDGWITHRQQRYICATGVHGVMESQRDERLRQIHNEAGLVTLDGMPLVWLSHLHGHDRAERVYGPDLMLALCKHSLLMGYKHFFYGGGEGVHERLARNLQQRFPGLRVVGGYSPPFRPLNGEEDEQVVQAINAADPDIVWIGLSTPKQERWMAEHLGRLTAPVLIGVGAAFDFHSGLKKVAPRWMQRSGLEWLFRLASEPERLWRRYLVNNPLFVLLVLQQALGLERYPAR